MKVSELNSVLVYLKVNDVHQIEYVSAIGELMPTLQDNLELYCYKYKKSIPVSTLVKTAKEHGYNEEQY
tara:strand:- start:1391 stop:1597 length:207 start_codon:yes stop_codon:yes gene_type:complete